MGLCLGSPAHHGETEIIYEGTTGSSDPNWQILIYETQNFIQFSFADLKSATNNFKSDNLLGEGRFGSVFKAWMDERTAGTGMRVAIKKLNPETIQYFQEGQLEVNFLGRLSHPIVVNLLGYCREDKELLLVYEFMKNGSLENHLLKSKNLVGILTLKNLISWYKRLKIAIGVARGLAFLHGSEKPVMYREFKASNILLDENYNAKIADFGFDISGPTVIFKGFSGYVAPEYPQTGHLSVKNDVYSFGVLLLEFITGLRALDRRRPMGQHILADWLKPCLSNKIKLKTIMDKRMEGQYTCEAAFYVAQLTLKCLDQNPRNRPFMKDVVETLEHIAS